MTAADIIRALGGTHCVAALTGVGRSGVTNWTRTGIPRHHWARLAIIARDKPETEHITLDVLVTHTFGPGGMGQKRRPGSPTRLRVRRAQPAAVAAVE